MSATDSLRDESRQRLDLHWTEGGISEQQFTASTRKKAACNDISSEAEHQVRKLRSAQAVVIRAMLWELRDSAAPEDQTDCVSADGRPWRWHLAGEYIIDYRPLTKQDKNTRCPNGGYLISQVKKPTPEMLMYMRLKRGVLGSRKQ